MAVELILIGILNVWTERTSVAWTQAILTLIWTFTFQLSAGQLGWALPAEVGSTRLRQKTICLARNAYYICGVIGGSLENYFMNPEAWNLKGELRCYCRSLEYKLMLFPQDTPVSSGAAAPPSFSSGPFSAFPKLKVVHSTNSTFCSRKRSQLANLPAQMSMHSMKRKPTSLLLVIRSLARLALAVQVSYLVLLIDLPTMERQRMLLHRDVVVWMSMVEVDVRVLLRLSLNT